MAGRRKKTRRTSSSTEDRATQYALDVDAGKAIAGPYVRAACRRHLNDLENGADRGLHWDVEASERALRYFQFVLTVEVEDDDGLSHAAPFLLEPWQCFCIGSLFGWKNYQGFRRFRRAYMEIGKGNGKSPMAAGIGHYMLTATDKLRPEVYSAATDRDQAAILFRDAVAMYERSPKLLERLHPSGQNPVWQLTDHSTGGFFKPISSEKKGKSGIRPYCALIDEIHEHPDNSVIEMLRAGTKGNQQALILEITNSGFDRTSVCWQEHDYSIKIVTGEEENDAWFSFVCSLDEDDDPFEDEDCWIKANPNLGVSIRLPFIREQVGEAKGMPSKESIVRRLHFCQWTDAAETWISQRRWSDCEAEMDIEAYRGDICYAGLDLSYTRDLTALGVTFPQTDGTLDSFVFFWKPKDSLKEAIHRDNVPYDQWAKRGFIELTDGQVIKLAPIAERLQWLAENFQLQVVAYDAYRHRELADDLADMGIILPMIEHPQGFRRQKDSDLWMPNSFQDFENSIIEGRHFFAINPVLRWTVASAVVRNDPAGTDNRIFDKLRARGRIDGVVALTMSTGAATRSKGPRVQEIEYTRGQMFA